MRKFLSSLDLEPGPPVLQTGRTASGRDAGPASDTRKRPAPAPAPAGQSRLRDCAKVVLLDRRDDPAETAKGLVPALSEVSENADPAAQLAALRTLACLRVDRALLASTGVGVAVRKLKRSPHVEVAVSAARLVDKWKALVLDELAASKRAKAGGGGGGG